MEKQPNVPPPVLEKYKREKIILLPAKSKTKKEVPPPGSILDIKI